MTSKINYEPWEKSCLDMPIKSGMCPYFAVLWFENQPEYVIVLTHPSMWLYNSSICYLLEQISYQLWHLLADQSNILQMFADNTISYFFWLYKWCFPDYNNDGLSWTPPPPPRPTIKVELCDPIVNSAGAKTQYQSYQSAIPMKGTQCTIATTLSFC